MRQDLTVNHSLKFVGTNLNHNMNADSRPVIIILDDAKDVFQHAVEDDSDILPGPLGHPHTGRPVGLSDGDVKNYEDNLTFLNWLFDPERKLYKRPKTMFEKLFSLKDIKFDDDVAKFHAQQATELAASIAKGHSIARDALGDINGDGITDTILSGINVPIDIDGDGIADVVGTLMDTTGDGIADSVLNAAGKLIKLGSKAAEVIEESGVDSGDAACAFETFVEFVRSVTNK